MWIYVSPTDVSSCYFVVLSSIAIKQNSVLHIVEFFSVIALLDNKVCVVTCVTRMVDLFYFVLICVQLTIFALRGPYCARKLIICQFNFWLKFSLYVVFTSFSHL